LFLLNNLSIFVPKYLNIHIQFLVQMLNDFENIQVRTRKVVKDRFEELYIQSGLKTKGRFIELLMNCYRDYNVLGYNDLIYQREKLISENNQLISDCTKMQELERKICSLENEFQQSEKEIIIYCMSNNRLKDELNQLKTKFKL